MGIDFLVGPTHWRHFGERRFSGTGREIAEVTQRCDGWGGAWYASGNTKSETILTNASVGSSVRDEQLCVPLSSTNLPTAPRS